MQTDKVIEHLKAKTTATNIFRIGSTEARISGAADFSAVVDDQRLLVPSMFVLLGEGEVQDMQYKPGFSCTFKETIHVVVVLSGTPDRRQQSPQQAVNDIKWWLLSVLQGWSPDANWNGLYLMSDKMWGITPARYYHYFTFSQFLMADEDILATDETLLNDLRSVQGTIEPAGATATTPELCGVNVSGLYLTTVAVSGAGSLPLYGDYVHITGEYVTSLFMRPIYRKGNYYIAWNETLTRWELRDATTVYLINLSNDQFPPTGPWSVISGLASVPVLTHKE